MFLAGRTFKARLFAANFLQLTAAVPFVPPAPPVAPVVRALPPSLYVNDVDLARYGVSVGTPRGWADPPPVTDRYTAVPGRAGGYRIASEAEIGTRTFSVSGVLLTESVTERNANWDIVKRILGGPSLDIRFADYPDRMAEDCRARAGSFEALGPDGRFTVEFTSTNGYLVGTQTEVYAIANGATVPLVLGTAPSDLTLHLVSIGVALPTVFYRDAQGLIQGYVAYELQVGTDAGEWATGDWIEYSPPDEPLISYLHRAGDVVGVNVGSALTTSQLPSADPDDGDATEGPTLQAVNCNCIAICRKAFR